MVPFGFTSTPAAFIYLMNNGFSKYLDRLVLIFLDSILIYFENEEEHVKHLRLTLELLRKHKLYAGLSKCEFYEDTIHYLGHIISDRGISGDPKKIKAMMSQYASRNLTDVRSFVELAWYWMKFII